MSTTVTRRGRGDDVTRKDKQEAAVVYDFSSGRRHSTMSPAVVVTVFVIVAVFIVFIVAAVISSAFSAWKLA